jgi:hypothetical protein
MGRINEGHESIGYPDEEEIVILEESASVPRDDEEAKGDRDAEEFSQAVKNEVVMQAHHVEADENQAPAYALPCEAFAAARPRASLGALVLRVSLDRIRLWQEIPDALCSFSLHGAEWARPHRFAPLVFNFREDAIARSRVLKRGLELWEMINRDR